MYDHLVLDENISDCSEQSVSCCNIVVSYCKTGTKKTAEVSKTEKPFFSSHFLSILK